MTTQALDGFLCCLVGANQYTLRGDDVTLVARAEQMHPRSGAHDRVGTLSRGGVQIPVYDLAARLGGARDSRTADRHVIVTGGSAAPYGLLVDRIVRARLSGGEVLPLPAVLGGPAARWFSGLLALEETSCLVLAPEGLRPGGGERPSTRGPQARAAGRPVDAELQGLMLAFSSPALPAFSVEHHAVSAVRVAAVVQSFPLVPLPGCERHVAALGSWRRAVVIVLDFRAGAAAAPASRRFLIMRCDGGALVALPIDADTMLRRATPQDARAATAVLPEYMRGVFHAGGERIALLDVDRLAAGADGAGAAAAVQDARVPALV